MKNIDRNVLFKFKNKIKDQNVLLKKEVDQHTEKIETELIKSGKIYTCIPKRDRQKRAC